MKRVHVAAAVIRGSDDRILIAKRAQDKHQGGLWEFPGGKVEPGERPEAALIRELREELRGAGAKFHTDGDSEVILAAWQRWGPDCVAKRQSGAVSAKRRDSTTAKAIAGSEATVSLS